MSMDALIGQFLSDARRIAEDVVRREGVRLRTATVESVDPLRIRYDGETTPSVVPPRRATPVGLGDRVVVAKARGQATILGVLGATAPTLPESPYRRIAGALRKTDGAWHLIDDAGHTPQNITSVADEGDGLRIQFGFTASKVGALVVTPDETYAQHGYTMGASVGLSSAKIMIGHPGGSIGGYVTYEGGGWTVGHGPATGVQVMDTAIIRITHPPQTPADEIALSITARGGGNFVYRSEGAGTGHTDVGIYNSDGTAVTGFVPEMRFFFTRHSRGGPVAPADMPEGNSNIWVHGVLEA